MDRSKYPGDEVIIKALESESDLAFQWLYKMTYPSVLKMVTQNNGVREEANDIFQDTIMVFFEKIQGGDFVLKSSINTYIYAVARHLWLKKLRQKGKGSMVYLEDDEILDVKADLDKFEEEERRMAKLSMAIEAIGEPCRSLLKDFYFENMSMQEIALKFGYTNAENAKNQKYKCLQRLRKIFFTKE